MGLFDSIFRRSSNGAAKFGYDAAVDAKKRRPPKRSKSIEAEDNVLDRAKRKNVQSTARDLQRNFSLVAWAVRRHLDYVASFSFNAKTGDAGLDADVEAFIAEWSKPQNCDVAGRHRFDRFFRIAEARRMIDGDVFIVKTRGGQLQAIEADRVRNPAARDDTGGKLSPEELANFVHGIETDARGRARRYAVWNRKPKSSGYDFASFLPARHVFPLGCYDRFDQLRGISPIVAALNSFQDCYEGIDYALAKAKVSQIMAFAFYRDAVDSLTGTAPTVDSDDDGVADSSYEFTPPSGGQIALLDLEDGDRAEILESKTPSAEFRDFITMTCQVALKALDIPYSFFDESHTNFYGSRGGLIQYLKSSKAKRADQIEARNDVTRWRLGLAVADGALVLPRGIDFADLRFEWIPDGVPFWDTAKETRGARMAVESGFDNPLDVCRKIGTDFYSNIDAIAEAVAYAKDKGVQVRFDYVADTVVVGGTIDED